MSWYRWQGLHAEQGAQRGLVQAASRPQAITQLRRNRVLAKSLQPLAKRQRSSSSYLINFLHQWHSLLGAGFDQRHTWQHLHQQSNSWLQADASAGVIRSLNEGRSIAQSMAMYPRLFPTTLTAWIEIGENTGRLPDVLQGLVNNLQAAQLRSEQMRSALRYPLIVLAVAALTLVLMVLFLLPRFANVYAQLEVQLPVLTEQVLRLHHPALQQQLLLSAAALGGLGLLLRQQLQQRLQQANGARRLYQLPLIGGWWCTQHLLHDLEMLRLTIESAIPLQQACELVAQHSASGYWRACWRHTARALGQGSGFAQSLSGSLIPNLILEAVATGEQSGRLSQQLTFAMAQLTKQMEKQQQQVSQILPALVLIAVSIIVLLLLLALYLPLFQLGQTVR